MDEIGKKILLSAGITLGVAVSGVSLYLLLKPEDERQYWRPENEKRKINENNHSVVTIRVPQQFVGAVIGRGGEHIKRIQSETHTKINFDSNSSKEKNGLKEYRILLIRGSPENTIKAEVAINEIISEQSKVLTKHFTVDTNAIGGIIGRNGENIRSLSEKSGAKINVDRNSKSSKSIMTSIWISGTDEQIAEAVLLINSEIAQCQNLSRNRNGNRHANQLTKYKLFAIEDESTENKINFETYFAKLEPMNQNQSLEVFVSAVESPDRFYVQLCSTGADLDRLMDETTDFYEIEDNRISFKPLNIKVGDIVAVPYQFDEHWYRAKVLSVQDKPYSLEESEVGVFYLDYGDMAVVKYEQICDLKDDILNRMPFQAIECSLSGVAPKDGSGWSEEAISTFKELTHNALWKTIYAKVVDVHSTQAKRDKYVIELFDRQCLQRNDLTDDDWDSPKVTSVNLNIGQELIRRHVALPYQ